MIIIIAILLSLLIHLWRILMRILFGHNVEWAREVPAQQSTKCDKNVSIGSDIVSYRITSHRIASYRWDNVMDMSVSSYVRRICIKNNANDYACDVMKAINWTVKQSNEEDSGMNANRCDEHNFKQRKKTNKININSK